MEVVDPLEDPESGEPPVLWFVSVEWSPPQRASAITLHKSAPEHVDRRKLRMMDLPSINEITDPHPGPGR